MVETRENSPSKRKLSLLDFSKMASLIGMGATFLTACQEVGVIPVHAQEPSDTQPPETAVEPGPVIEATPTSENAPAAFTENLPALERMGFNLRQGEKGWELVDTNGIVAFASADALTITAYGKNGELIVVPEQRFGITGTQGLGMEQIITLKNEQGVNEYMYLEAGYSVPIQEQYDNFEDLENCPRVDMDALWDGTLAHSEAINAKEFPEGTIAPDGFGYTLWKGAQTYWTYLSDIVKGVTDETSDTNYKTYHRRYVGCYRSTTPDGVEIVIGTEQVLMPDNKTSFFLHYIFDWKRWNKGKDFLRGGIWFNLGKSVFQAYTQPPEPGFGSVRMRPVIFLESFDPNLATDEAGFSLTGTLDLYKLPQNDPASIFVGVDQLTREREPNTNGPAFLDWVDQEAIKAAQNLGLYSNWLPAFKRDAFFSDNH